MNPKLRGCHSTVAEAGRRVEAGPHLPPAKGGKESGESQKRCYWLSPHRAKGRMCGEVQSHCQKVEQHLICEAQNHKMLHSHEISLARLCAQVEEHEA